MIGTKLGSYELQRELGQGGMSVVYYAVRADTTEGVAVKVLQDVLTDDTVALERFQREARLVSRLQHPHILPVVDFDLKHRPPYIVMRYLSGGNLEDKVQAARLPIADILRLVDQVAGALDYAHAQGVVHRDLKPANILFDEQGKAFLTDFGIARYKADLSLTASGTVLGTPEYMSPEQILGTKELTGAVDVYALGIIMFKLLTNTLPYTGNSEMSLMFKHLHDPVPALTERNPKLPIAVDAVLAKALAKAPKDRYATAEVFAKALRLVLG